MLTFNIFYFMLEILCCILVYKLGKFLIYFFKLLIFLKSVPEAPEKTSSKNPMLAGGGASEKQFKLHKMWILPFLPFVRVYHPDTIKPLLKKDGLRNSSYFCVLHRLTLNYNSLVACDDQVLVKEQRRIMCPFFNRKSLINYHIEISSATETLLENVEKRLQMKKRCSVNVLPLLTRLLVEIHLKIFVSFDPHKNVRNVDEFISAELEYTKLRHYRNKKWYLHPDFVYYLTPYGIKDFILVRRLRSLVKSWLRSKQQNQNTNGSYDIIDELLNKSHQNISDNATTMVTTTRNVVSTTTMCLLYLAKYPLYQRVIRREVKVLFNGKNIRTDLRDEDFSKLLNTMMFLKEVLRFHPPLNYTERQITEDVEVDGITFPKGTYFHIDIYGLHHNEALWDKPNEFIPERFANAPKPHTTDGMTFLPFMAYSRDCVAKLFVIEEIVIILARILQRFDIECDEHFVMSDDRINQMQKMVSGCILNHSLQNSCDEILMKCNVDVMFIFLFLILSNLYIITPTQISNVFTCILINKHMNYYPKYTSTSLRFLFFLFVLSFYVGNIANRVQSINRIVYR